MKEKIDNIRLAKAIKIFINIEKHAKDDLKCLEQLKWWQFFTYKKMLKLCRENQQSMLSDIKVTLCWLENKSDNNPLDKVEIGEIK